MYRLLQTAQELVPTFDAAFSIDSKGHLEAEFADIVEAIHIVQDNMQILGTTANEASGTVSGSIATMKAALSQVNYDEGILDIRDPNHILFKQFT